MTRHAMLHYKGRPVPYIAAWSQERVTDVASGDLMLRTEMLTGAMQLRYRDEQAADRDRHGILWHRVTWAPGHGRPLFADSLLNTRVDPARKGCVRGRVAGVLGSFRTDARRGGQCPVGGLE